MKSQGHEIPWKEMYGMRHKLILLIPELMSMLSGKQSMMIFLHSNHLLKIMIN